MLERKVDGDWLASYWGRLEYFFRRQTAGRRGGPFNGQTGRQGCYRELNERFSFSAIIETGAHRGTTTALFAEAEVPVYSIEVMARFASYSSARFCRQPHVQILHGDSRQLLRQLAQSSEVPRDNVFFYLDAHWYDDLPLREEIDIIRQHWTNWVVMVDDFAVPGTEYQYDAYGPGRNLDEAYLRPFVQDGVELFFPTMPVEEETGYQRGSVVLGEGRSVVDRLSKCQTIQSFSRSSPIAAIA